MIKVEKIVVGQLRTNCYLVWEEESNEGVIIDPGDDGEYLIEKINQLGFSPKFILATHGHFDHILAVTELKLVFNIPFLIHQKDLFLLKRASQSAKFFTGINPEPILPPDKFLEEGQEIVFQKEKIKVLFTPGHTPGSVSFLAENFLFSGDLIFADGVGRTDFSYSSYKDLEKSIKRIFLLPPQTIIFPGHGEEFGIKKA
ncbi:MAG: MBL fold metallo-hydrolase [Microgenomates group bacterium]